jgi:hypothetical protein
MSDNNLTEYIREFNIKLRIFAKDCKEADLKEKMFEQRLEELTKVELS